MERDTMLSHGASNFINERLFTSSDPFQVSVCENCGIMTSELKKCQKCQDDKTKLVNYPYASKLLHTELMGMLLKLDIEPS
jgi:DNA-directed RNA polymerase II subunit RPB2